MDFKENQRSIAEKDASYGVLYSFQKCPKQKNFGKSFAFSLGFLETYHFSSKGQ